MTRRVRLDRADAGALRRTSGGFATFAAECTEEWISHLERTTPGDDWDQGSCALHDPLAVAVVARPDLVTWRPARVSVERGSDRTRGVAVTDLLGTDGPAGRQLLHRSRRRHRRVPLLLPSTYRRAAVTPAT